MRNRLIAFGLWWAIVILFLCLLAVAVFTVLLLIGTFIHQAWGFLILVPLVCVPTGIILYFGLGQLLDFTRRKDWALSGGRRKH